MRRTRTSPLLVLALAACSGDRIAPTDSTDTTSMAAASAASHAGHTGLEHRELTPAQRQAVADVRQATVHFREFAASQRAKYTSQYPAGCAVSPNGAEEGAQGFHYLNEGLVDDKVELLRPELLMYEPQPNGQLQLVGVDYIIPFDKWTSSEAPTLLGVPMMRNEPLKVWALHIWAWRPNPSGMFAAWNPKVSCSPKG